MDSIPTASTSTSTSTFDAADVRFHKILSRGSGADAQVLLALVSTRCLATDEPFQVWASINRKTPVSMPAEGRQDSVEAARPIEQEELLRLDLERKDDEPPFGLSADTARRFWLARFELSEHASVKSNWEWLFGGAQDVPPRRLDLIAWRSCFQSELDGDGVEAGHFEPLPGHALAEVGTADIVSQPPFELGVLFVHGIGHHGVRQTLVEWAEPIVKLWRDLGLEISGTARATLPDVERRRISRWVRSLQLRNRIPLDGISQAVDDFEPGGADPKAHADAPGNLERPPTTGPRTSFTYARPEQTLFGDLEPGTPSATLLRLSSVDTNAMLREAHVLFAEAFWTREAFAPTFTDLYIWLTTAIPVAVWARLQRLFSTRPNEIARFWRGAKSRFDRFRVCVSASILVVQWALMPTIYVVLALAAQIAIGLVGLVGVVPIPWVRSIARLVMSTLLGTLGQSFALQTSVIRRSAIVSAVRSDLDWLCDKCHRVVVVSHSQGAEVSRLVFLDGRRQTLARWYTVGSGIVPLALLHPRSLASPETQKVVRASRIALAAVVATLALLAIDSIPGAGFGAREFLAARVRSVGWTDILPFYVLVTAAAAVFGLSAPPLAGMQLRRSVMAKWRDVFASDDPVPAGSLMDRFENDFARQKIPKPWQSRVFNTRFAFLDHTSYVRNVEQVVAPIALDLLRLLGIGWDERLERPALARAASRRDLLTWWNMLVSVLGGTAFVATLAWSIFGPAARGAAWFSRGETIWSGTTTTWQRISLSWTSGFVGEIFVDLRWSLAILLVLCAWWLLCLWLGQRSIDGLVQGLAAGARRARAPRRAR